MCYHPNNYYFFACSVYSLRAHHKYRAANFLIDCCNQLLNGQPLSPHRNTLAVRLAMRYR